MIKLNIFLDLLEGMILVPSKKNYIHSFSFFCHFLSLSVRPTTWVIRSRTMTNQTSITSNNIYPTMTCWIYAQSFLKWLWTQRKSQTPTQPTSQPAHFSPQGFMWVSKSWSKLTRKALLHQHSWDSLNNHTFHHPISLQENHSNGERPHHQLKSTASSCENHNWNSWDCSQVSAKIKVASLVTHIYMILFGNSLLPLPAWKGSASPRLPTVITNTRMTEMVLGVVNCIRIHWTLFPQTKRVLLSTEIMKRNVFFQKSENIFLQHPVKWI